jgi:hypothetical protein
MPEIGFVPGMRLNSVSIETAGNLVNRKQYEVQFDVNKIDKAIGHYLEESLQMAVKSYNWTPLGNLEICEDCDVGKSKQKNTNKYWLLGSKNTGGILSPH